MSRGGAGSARGGRMAALLAFGLTLAPVLAPSPARGQAPELGRPAPTFTLPDLAGKPVALEDFRGTKGVLVNFWATWCAPCREEMPTLERLARDHAASLQVLGVSMDVIGTAKVRAFLKEVGATFPVLLDPEAKAARLYRVRALPMTFIVGKDGVVRYRDVGYRDWTTAESRYVVEDALRPR